MKAITFGSDFAQNLQTFMNNNNISLDYLENTVKSNVKRWLNCKENGLQVRSEAFLKFLKNCGFRSLIDYPYLSDSTYAVVRSMQPIYYGEWFMCFIYPYSREQKVKGQSHMFTVKTYFFENQVQLISEELSIFDTMRNSPSLVRQRSDNLLSFEVEGDGLFCFEFTAHNVFGSQPDDQILTGFCRHNGQNNFWFAKRSPVEHPKKDFALAKRNYVKHDRYGYELVKGALRIR